MDQNVVIPVVCFVGDSKSGKTALLKKVIPALITRGYRVAAAKHAAHGYQPDRLETDSCCLEEAGARMAAVVAPGVSIIRVHDSENDAVQSLQDIVSEHVRDVDIVLAEGFSYSPYPKVVVGDCSKKLAGEIVLGVASPAGDDEPAVLQPDNIEKIAGFIESRFLVSDGTACPGTCCSGCSGVSLLVDGKRVPLNRFSADVLAGAVRGVIKTFKGCEDVSGAIEITITDTKR